MRRRLLAIAMFCALALPLAAQTGDFQIRGIVVNGTNNFPLPLTHVTITPAGTNGPGRTVIAGEDGRFAFDHVRAGKYALAAERRGFAVQRYEQHEGGFSTAIVVAPDLDAGDLVFRMSPDASFSGNITDDRNEPVRSARVMLVHELMVEGRMSKRIVANATTDDRGHYHFAHLRPGAYFIAVSTRPWYAQMAFVGGMGVGRMRGGGGGGGFGPREQTDPALDVTYPLTFYPDVTDASAASPITLHAGDRASADITLRAVQALHVRINNATSDKTGDQRQFGGATLIATMFDGIEVPMQTITRPVGNNASMISGVAPGHYLLRLQTPMRRLQRAALEEGDESAQPARVREVDLVSDTELDANEMSPTAMVSGTVKLANGQAPAKPPTIELRRGAMRRMFSAAANADGEFRFPQGFAAGTYEVVMSSGDQVFIRGVSATGAQIAGRMLHITGSDVKLNIVAIEGAGKIEGVAVRDGKPQSGAMILLAPQDPENNRPLFRRDQSDSDGSFTLRAVLPGRYTLLALENGWDLPWGDAEVLRRFLADGKAVIVEAKGEYKVRVNVQ